MPTANVPEDFSIEGHPLADLVPEAFFAEDYVGRILPGGVSDQDAFAAAHRMRHNLILAGPTGAAKTSAVYAYAASIGMPVVNVACNGGADARQLLGGWTPTADGGFTFQPGDLVTGVQHGAIILLNEVNFLPPKIAAVLYGLLDKRRTIYIAEAAGSDFPTVVKAHKSTFVVADFNPGYQGTRPLNEAFKNRYCFFLDWGYDSDVEAELVTSASLLELADKLRQRVEAGDLTTVIPTNKLMEFEDITWDEALGLDFAIYNFVSTFDPTERVVVQEVLDMYRPAIEEELLGS